MPIAVTPWRKLRRMEADTRRRIIIMGKYFIAWLLGVPAGLLVLIYAFTHLL
jgi:hypothetical protein